MSHLLPFFVICSSDHAGRMPGREPVMRMSTSLLALCCQPGPEAYMGDADQRPKQVEGVEISSYIAALDCALDQRINRRLDQAAGTLIKLRGAPRNTVQCGGNNLLCGDVIDEQQHPGSQSLNRRQGFGKSTLFSGQLFHFTPVDGLNYSEPRSEGFT